MPAKYMIHTRPVPHRFAPISKSGIIAWEEGCLKCAVCVKKRCVYRVYDNRALDSRYMIDSIDNQCMNCFRCVQGCPKELIHKSLNPEYKALGDSYWTPEIISRLWYQAETGKIPVSGAGYPGPFSGPGFDSMWTDMSEIVRPTRDGIHGREYISTAIDLGKTPSFLSFGKEGDLVGDKPFLVDIPVPIVLKRPPFGAISDKTIQGWIKAARRLGTLMALPQDVINRMPQDSRPWLIPILQAKGFETKAIPEDVRLAEIPWNENWKEMVEGLRVARPDLLTIITVPMADGVEEKVISVATGGVSIIHVQGSPGGAFFDEGTRTVKEGIRSVHQKLVSARIRDAVTLLVSGGISMAEHVAKAIICGADGVFADIPILIALECRLCRRCTKDLSCPVDIGDAPADWVALRTVNLMGAWHNQLLEVMGAMGIRDARRLRGEAGRAMFFEDLDRSTFESLGSVEEGSELE
jgi:ferredoxin